MYRLHYKLRENPFHLSPDPRFMWLGKQQKEALAALRHGNQGNDGITILTGDTGTGKTTLINAFVGGLPKDAFVSILSHPTIGRMDFFNFLAESFNFHQRFKDKSKFIAFFNSFLRISCKFSKRVIIVIDEAHKITPELLEEILVFSNYKMVEEIRMISKITKRYRNPLNIYLVGQNELDQILNKREYNLLKHKAKKRYRIRPLTEVETQEYIKYRLKIAGAVEEVFSDKAVKVIYKFSAGYPRVINILCENALLTGYFKKAKQIKPRIVKECAKRLGYLD